MAQITADYVPEAPITEESMKCMILERMRRTAALRAAKIADAREDGVVLSWLADGKRESGRLTLAAGGEVSASRRNAAAVPERGCWWAEDGGTCLVLDLSSARKTETIRLRRTGQTWFTQVHPIQEPAPCATVCGGSGAQVTGFLVREGARGRPPQQQQQQQQQQQPADGGGGSGVLSWIASLFTSPAAPPQVQAPELEPERVRTPQKFCRSASLPSPPTPWVDQSGYQQMFADSFQRSRRSSHASAADFQQLLCRHMQQDAQQDQHSPQALLDPHGAAWRGDNRTAEELLRVRMGAADQAVPPPPPAAAAKPTAPDTPRTDDFERLYGSFLAAQVP